eukprot:CAMPEP_0119342446 /NCGR_PEP_ID=MMETSP1333-20130426/104724_1 /TAXON_ID=418940 /ORGANISM="Scyphosphaera apsteinii, Strain RCC1455" /LENGTH=304 /DNA_ID=CAMNT_0007354663 /DNA_START=123 /DNA_END=1037 /DNA_ORIENTATION=-
MAAPSFDPAPSFGPKIIRIAPNVWMPMLSMGVSTLRMEFVQLGGRGLDTGVDYGEWEHKNLRQTLNKLKRMKSSDLANLFVTSKIPCCPATPEGDGSLGKRWRGIWPKMCIGLDGGAGEATHVRAALVAQVGARSFRPAAASLAVPQMESHDIDVESDGETSAEASCSFNRRLNFDAKTLEQLVHMAAIKPAVNQCGLTVGFHGYPEVGGDKATLDKCRELNITYQAYGPHGLTTKMDVLSGNRVLGAVSARCGRSASEVALRWAMQEWTPVVFSSNNYSHVRANLGVFDFELSREDMRQLENA